MTRDDGWSNRDERPSVAPWREVAAGVCIVVIEHALVAGLLGGGGYLIEAAVANSGDYLALFLVWGFAIGCTQTAYVVPTFVVAFVTRRSVAAGVALAAVATFLLNGACFGAMCGVFSA